MKRSLIVAVTSIFAFVCLLSEARAEWAGIGKHPASTGRVVSGLKQRISALAVPRRIARGALRNLARAQKLRPATRDRSDAVIEHKGLKRAWLSFTGRKLLGSGNAVKIQRYVSANIDTGGGMHSPKVTYQHSRTNAKGYKRSLWREAVPLNNGQAIEHVMYTRYQVQDVGERVLSLKSKYWLTDGSGKRVAQISQDQAWKIERKVGARSGK